jgi:hypothetical protein
MSTGLVRKSAMLAREITPRDDAIELHEELRICPYLACQLLEV